MWLLCNFQYQQRIWASQLVWHAEVPTQPIQAMGPHVAALGMRFWYGAYLNPLPDLAAVLSNMLIPGGIASGK